MAVTDVQPDSVAWKAGLRTGSFISHVNGRRVSNPGEFARLTMDDDEAVGLRVSVHPGEIQSLTVPAPSPSKD